MLVLGQILWRLPQNTTVLLIDPNNDDRQHWTERLKSSSPHYKVFEAKDAETGLVYVNLSESIAS